MLLEKRVQDHEQRLARLELTKSMKRIRDKTPWGGIKDNSE